MISFNNRGRIVTFQINKMSAPPSPPVGKRREISDAKSLELEISADDPRTVQRGCSVGPWMVQGQMYVSFIIRSIDILPFLID